MAEIEVFSEGILALGNDYAYPPLAKWGEQLRDQASTFRVDILPQTLGELPAITQDLKSVVS